MCSAVMQCVCYCSANPVEANRIRFRASVKLAVSNIELTFILVKATHILASSPT